jgi:UPF0271 protein
MTSTAPGATVDLNADMGESFGAWQMGDDDSLLAIVSSANVACGFHAGDPVVMTRTVKAAAARGVRIGAHPAFPDLQGFGRRRMHVDHPELEAQLIYQLGALAGIAAAEGTRVGHVKPHGALNNMACEDTDLAEAVARAVKRFDPALPLMAPTLSPLADAGERAGLPVIHEAFADRTYTPDGRLTPRAQPGAVIHDAVSARDHVLRMIDAQSLFPADGPPLPCRIDSICVHGDGPEALAIARTVRDGLAAQGFSVSHGRTDR